jgi:hypothetical protein
MKLFLGAESVTDETDAKLKQRFIDSLIYLDSHVEEPIAKQEEGSRV